MGNSHLAMGQKLKKAFYMREAIRQYNTALAEPFENATLRAVLHSNRAQAESLLGNWGNALRDATAALRFDPDNLKVLNRCHHSACATNNHPSGVLSGRACRHQCRKV